MRNNKDVLLNALDIFVKEPLVEWVKLAKRTAANIPEAGKNPYWFPRRKLDIVNKKIDGWNPAVITQDELKETDHSKQPYFKGVVKAVLGDTPHIRAKISQRCSNIQEQVDCLIDQATDPSILGRAWIGWASYS